MNTQILLVYMLLVAFATFSFAEEITVPGYTVVQMYGRHGAFMTRVNEVLAGTACAGTPKHVFFLPSSSGLAFLAGEDPLAEGCIATFTGELELKQSEFIVDDSCLNQCGNPKCTCPPDSACTAPEDPAQNPCPLEHICYKDRCVNDNFSKIIAVKVEFSREPHFTIDKKKHSLTIDLYYNVRTIYLEEEFAKVGCSALDAAQSSIVVYSGPKSIEAYVPNEACLDLDFDAITKAVNDRDVDDYEYEETPGVIEVRRSKITITSISSHVLKDQYPVSCIHSGAGLRCYSPEHPECDVVCGMQDECDPDEADKYCHPYRGCVSNPIQDLSPDEDLPPYVCYIFMNTSSMMSTMLGSLLTILAVCFLSF